MDIEHLSKSQIVLLTLLVSFVTSIATGIVTVSLVEQAPPAVAQTVNRIVERTVEKVVPSSQSASVVTTEKTVVVKESDLIATAVARTSPSIVRLYKQEKDASGKDTEVFLGLGVVIGKGGLIVSESLAVEGAGGAVVALSDGTRAWGSFVAKDAASGTMTLQGATSTDAGPIAWQSISVDATSPVLGETVVAVAGRSASRISSGIITALPNAEADTVAVFETSITEGDIMAGSPLINTNGELVGMSTSASRAEAKRGFIPASVLPGVTPPPEPKPAS